MFMLRYENSSEDEPRKLALSVNFDCFGGEEKSKWGANIDIVMILNNRKSLRYFSAMIPEQELD